MVLFTLQFHSVLDVITNSSSELFVGLHNSKKLMIELVKDIYSGYRGEYSEIMTIDGLSDYDLDMYISYHYEHWSNAGQRTIRNVPEGFEWDEMYEVRKFGEREYTAMKPDFVKDNRERLNKSIDPDKKMFFMFSLDENPDWEMQEQLMNIMQRYHLG